MSIYMAKMIRIKTILSSRPNMNDSKMKDNSISRLFTLNQSQKIVQWFYFTYFLFDIWITLIWTKSGGYFKF